MKRRSFSFATFLGACGALLLDTRLAGPRRRVLALRSTSIEDRPKLSEEEKQHRLAAFMMARGYSLVNGEWKPPRRTTSSVVARARGSNRVLEVRVSGEAGPLDAARASVERFREVLRSVEDPGESARSAWESLVGLRLAVSPRQGALALVVAQLALCGLVGPGGTPLDMPPPTTGSWTEPAALGLGIATLFLAGSSPRGAQLGVSSLSGDLEGLVADGLRGSHALPAPRAWRSADRPWRTFEAALEAFAAMPRVVALHAAIQLPLADFIESSALAHVYVATPGDGTAGPLAALAPLAAPVAVAAFAALAELASQRDDDAARVAAECATVAAAASDVAGEPGDTINDDDALFVELCQTWLRKFGGNDVARADQARLLPGLAAARTLAAALAFRLTHSLIAPLALHALALADKALRDPNPGLQDDDPDRALLVLN